MLLVVRYTLAVAAVVAYVLAAASPDMPEEIWRMLAAGVVVGLAAGRWWALAVALVVVVPVLKVPVLNDGINDPEIPDSALILVYTTAGALSIGLGVGLTKLAGVLSRERGGSCAGERTGRGPAPHP